MLRFLILLSLCCTALAEPTQQAQAETNNFYLQQQIKQAADVASIKQQVTTQTDQLKKIAEELDAQKTQITELSQQQKAFDEQFNYQDLRKELLDRQQESIDWWWTVIGIFLAIVALIIPLLTRNYIKNLKEQIDDSKNASKQASEELEKVKEQIEASKQANRLAAQELDKIKTHSLEAEKIKQQISQKWDLVSAEKPNKELIENIKGSDDVTPLDEEIAKAYELQEKNDIDGAIVQWQQILGIAKFDQDISLQARAYFDIGYLLQEYKKENKQAIEVYQKAIELNPKYSPTYNNLGIAYVHLMQYEDAAGAFQKAIALNSEYDQAYYNLGFTHANLMQYEDAIAAYKKGLELNPEDSQAYNNLGFAYAILTQYEDAIAAYKKALEFNPENSRAYFNLFELELMTQGKLGKSLKQQFEQLFTETADLIEYKMLCLFEHLLDSGHGLSHAEKDNFREQFEGYDFGGWNWTLIDNWIEKQNPNEHLKDALEFFKTFDKKNS